MFFLFVVVVVVGSRLTGKLSNFVGKLSIANEINEITSLENRPVEVKSLTYQYMRPRRRQVLGSLSDKSCS